MAKYSMFILFMLVISLFFVAGAQTVSAQNKPIPDVKEKADECDDEDDEDDITAADRALIKVSIKDAKLIALQRVPGKVTDAELEKEKGRLQYAFDILGADGKTYDIEIDAVTGEVIQAELEDDDDDDGPVTKVVVKQKVVERTVVVAKKPQ